MTRSAKPPGCPLSGRQLEVLRLTAVEGLLGCQVAHQVGITESAVRGHLHRVYKKLDVTSRTAAVVRCFNAGWLDPGAADDPLRHEDRKVTCAQRVYLDAFDRACRTPDHDHAAQRDAKRRTDAALVAMGAPARSVTGREWMDRLLKSVARLP